MNPIRVLFSVPLAASLAVQTAAPAADRMPTLHLVGDSTVKNGSGDGAGGLWGWGQVVGGQFDLGRIRIANHAIGGRSSRTFLTEGRWERVADQLAPGDFLLVQFGHNDGGQMFEGSRPRASIKGNGDEVVEGVVENTGQPDTVYSYGWYLRHYIADARGRGAEVVICSPVPRNIWRDGKVVRAAGDYGLWAKEAAAAGGAWFLDLNEIVALRYERDGEPVVGADYFTSADHTHTSRIGAGVSAGCVAAGLRALEGCGLGEFLLPPPEPAAANASGGRSTASTRWRFDFGGTPPAPGFVAVAPSDSFDQSRGFGFEDAAPPHLATAGGSGAGTLRDSITSGRPFCFSAVVQEGCYRVVVTTGNRDAPATTTVKAELRRLMLERVETAPGEFVRSEFVVDVRTPRIGPGREVRLKAREREQEWRAWDDRLTLEFNGKHPSVATLEIEPAASLPVVFLIGDSTVCDQPGEDYCSWGQMLPRFFKPDIVVANHAESGESYRGAFAAGRFDKVFAQMRAGDYLLMQFGHNDQKSVDEASFSDSIRRAVAACREHGGTPVVLSPVERRRFDDGGQALDSHRGFPAAARAAAEALGAAFIDLHAMSKELYQSLGPGAAPRAFAAAGTDATHHNNYGAYQLSKCVVEGIREELPDLAGHLVAGLPVFDPTGPDRPDGFALRPSPDRAARVPHGN